MKTCKEIKVNAIVHNITLKTLSFNVKAKTGDSSYHVRLGEHISSSSVHRNTPAGMSITEAAPLNHHVVKCVVILLLWVPAFTDQLSVTKCEEMSEVHPNIGQCDQL